MANVVRDPKVHPDAIIHDLTKADPLVFTKDDIAFVYGHTDRSNAWAVETLKTWPEFSPWRVGELVNW